MEEVKILKLTPRKEYVGNPTCLGDRYSYGVKLSVDKDTGEKIAEVGDKLDLQAYIQASAKSTDIVSIIERLKGGDTSVINVNPNGFSGDVSLLPHNVNDVMKIGGLSDKAKASFDNLPEEVRGLFDNDPSKFFDAVINNKVDEIIKNIPKKVESASADEKGE